MDKEKAIEHINKTKKFLFEHNGIKVYEADGPYIRDNIETDFIGGGHHFVKYDDYKGKWTKYDWIPKDEVWVDKDLPDRIAIAKHELDEKPQMEDGTEYSKAHCEALEKEKKFREDFKDTRKSFEDQINEIKKGR